MIGRATTAAIHVAKKQLALEDDSYRDLLQRVAGVRSARDLDETGARKVMTEFERLGFVNQVKTVRGGRDLRPLARKARALWISLHNLDEIDNADDRALAAFAQRITGKKAMRFCDTNDLNRVVEGLKSWGLRVGWSDQLALGLVIFQLKRLRVGHADEVLDVNMLAPGDLNRLAGRLGERMRRLQLGHRHKSPTGEGAAT